MYTFFKVVTVKPPIVSQDKKIQDVGDSFATKKKIGTHLLPPFHQGHLYKYIGGIQSIYCFITQYIPFYQGHLYKFPPWTATYVAKYNRE